MSIIEDIKLNIKYALVFPRYIFTKFPIKIMTIEETLNYMSKPGNCVVRFGDGEFAILDSAHIANYQKYDKRLQQDLARVLNSYDNKKILICMPETLNGLSKFVRRTRKIWTINFVKNKKSYLKYINSNYLYGNSFVSRPYMIYKDKNKSCKWFESFRNIFQNKNILLVEGKYSRNGVGNDLFSEAKSVKRILCPNIDAYSKYDEILKEILKTNKNNLILLAIGPTSKPLVLELAKRGFWVIDIGHIDSEYEWYLKKANKKITINNKHTAEIVDKNIEDCNDSEYIKSIICEIK